MAHPPFASEKGRIIAHWNSIRPYKLKVAPYASIACAIIVCAVVLRLALIAHGWPDANSDEGTMGLEAMHIAYRGELPIFFYGQNYMGVLEAYIGALMFHLFGTSVFSLRLGMILLFTLFLISMYLLTSLLYTKKLALFTLGLLSLGSIDQITEELRAVGGAVETVLFGSLILLLASWLALTSGQESPSAGRRWRFAAYGGWGFAVGMGVWVHLLVLPFVLAGGLLLLFFCRRELWRWEILFLLVGLVIGAFPLIYYNLHAPFGDNSFFTAWRIQHTAEMQQQVDPYLFLKQILGTTLYSLPMATGLNPICTLSELPLYGPATARTIPCVIIQGGWSLGYILLLAGAIYLAVNPLWKLWRLRQARVYAWSVQERQAVAIQCARLMLLLAATITFLLYVLSPVSAIKPWSSRYLVGLLVATPAVFWPVWRSANTARSVKFGVLLRRLALVCICAAFVVTTLITLSTVPSVENMGQQEEALVQDLLHIGATRIYLGYWTCYRLMFQSQEKIICSVPPGLEEAGTNRYWLYQSIVRADAQAPYVFQEGSYDAVAFAKKIALFGEHYRQFDFDGYVVYQPQPAGSGAWGLTCPLLHHRIE